MMFIIAPNCGHEEHIFGEGGAKKLAQQYNIAMLGHIPLDIHIREMTDNGNQRLFKRLIVLMQKHFNPLH